jgi:hypothetical protein
MATMDWTQQMEEATKQWTDVQTKLWSGWGQAAQQATTQAQAKAVWQQMIDQWKNAVHRMLEMQVETARLWAENVGQSESLEGVAQWADQSYQMTKQWGTLQKQMWNSWFELLEQVDPAQMPAAMEFNQQPMMKLWNEMSQQATTMQQEWMKSWSMWQPTKKG